MAQPDEGSSHQSSMQKEEGFGPWMIPKQPRHQKTPTETARQTGTAVRHNTKVRVPRTPGGPDFSPSLVGQEGMAQESEHTDMGPTNGPHESRFATLADVDQDEDWEQRLVTMKKSIQSVLGPSRRRHVGQAHE